MRNIVSYLVMVCAVITTVSAQSGNITGKVSSKESDAASAVTVRVQNQKLRTTTNIQGVYTLSVVRPGEQTIIFSGPGFKETTKKVTVVAGETVTLNVELETSDIPMSEVTVYGAARRMQKITEAPAAISVVLPSDIERGNSHGQLAKTLDNFPGVAVVQSGMNDFNVNTRGFNNSINRRVLVLLDGRDPSTPLLNLVEWNSFQSSLSDVSKIEVVRGPGSALFGANAYNGVINITTATPLDVIGTRVSVTGGEYETFRANIRHAGEISDNWSYKLTANYSRQKQAWISSRDTAHGGSLEYPGLGADVIDGRVRRAGIDSIGSIADLIAANDIAKSISGTARVDYNLSPTELITAEIGASRYGGEYFVNTTGRILINDVEKPFARLAYNSKHWNVLANWSRRNALSPHIVMNATATSSERSDVAVIDAQWNDSFMDENLRLILGASHEYQHVNTTTVGASPLLSPDNLHNNFSGLYGQFEYRLLDNLQLVGAARFDRSTFIESQFSPKGGIVYTPIQNHTFRLTVNRSFLRPSYSDKFRRSVIGGLPPSVNLAKIDSTISAQTGVEKLGLPSVTPQVLFLGNPTIGVETALSYEFGYKGVITKELYVTVDGYWNHRTNFISQALGGLAKDYYKQIRYGNAQADSLMRVMLGASNYDRYQGLSLDVSTGLPAFSISPTNIGLINEYGLELGVNYYPINNLLLSANFTSLSYDIVENKVTAQKIVPNTSPARVNLGAQYEEQGVFDVGINIQGVKGFEWVAGLVQGSVPEYWVVTLNAGYNFTKDLRLGVNVFNLLDRKHYQIFGGTILRRYATAEVSFVLP
ncbi:MAG: TonB-dependent receptor [Bacteroidetes bacterium]|nr:TonB-dependent receptor [Bacteroidota bacterium]